MLMPCIFCRTRSDAAEIIEGARDVYFIDCVATACGLKYYLDGTVMASYTDISQVELDNLRRQVKAANAKNEPIEIVYMSTSSRGQIVIVPRTLRPQRHW